MTEHDPGNVSHPPASPFADPSDGRPDVAGQVAAFAADLFAVLLFAGIGRRAHDEGTLLGGTLATAAPFLFGAGLGWALLAAARTAPTGTTPTGTAPTGTATPALHDGRSLPAGAVVLLLTVGLGMSLRHLTGGGVPLSFVVVASTFLALFLLGWRAVARLVTARRTARGGGR